MDHPVCSLWCFWKSETGRLDLTKLWWSVGFLKSDLSGGTNWIGFHNCDLSASSPITITIVTMIFLKRTRTKSPRNYKFWSCPLDVLWTYLVTKPLWPNFNFRYTENDHRNMLYRRSLSDSAHYWVQVFGKLRVEILTPKFYQIPFFVFKTLSDPFL